MNSFSFFALSVFLTLFATVAHCENEGVEPDRLESICDCDDEEALYYKMVRQVRDVNGTSGVEEFLKDFHPRRTCGSDGHMYDSRCELHCEAQKTPDSDLQEAKRWKCRKHRGPPKRKNLKRKLNDAKPKVTEHFVEHPTVCICPRHYMPLCASNNITYGNQCTFDCAKRNLDPEITITKAGKCDDSDQTFI